MSIRSHTAKADALPRSLAEVRANVSSDGKELIDRSLVEYTPGKKIDIPEVKDSVQTQIYPALGQDAYEYRLCVTYKGDTSDTYDDTPYRTSKDITPNTYSHDSGRVCYDLVTEYTY